jgi:hypothetical protein
MSARGYDVVKKCHNWMMPILALRQPEILCGAIFRLVFGSSWTGDHPRNTPATATIRQILEPGVVLSLTASQ